MALLFTPTQLDIPLFDFISIYVYIAHMILHNISEINVMRYILGALFVHGTYIAIQPLHLNLHLFIG